MQTHWPEFCDPRKKFVVAAFVQESDLDDLQEPLESLGKQRNVKLVVQPCPYEGIEFLFQIDSQLMSHLSSMDPQLFWKGLAIKPEVNDKTWLEIAEVYHKYLCAVLEQNEKKVKEMSVSLQNFSKWYDV